MLLIAINQIFGNILILISSTIVKRIIQSKKPTILHKQEENRHSIYTQITNLCKISSHSFFTFSFSIFMEGEAKCTIEEIVNRTTINFPARKKKKKKKKNPKPKPIQILFVLGFNPMTPSRAYIFRTLLPYGMIALSGSENHAINNNGNHSSFANCHNGESENDNLHFKFHFCPAVAFLLASRIVPSLRAACASFSISSVDRAADWR